MRKVIDGKRYDTEKAEWMINCDRSRSMRNSYRVYRTKGGNWFELVIPIMDEPNYIQPLTPAEVVEHWGSEIDLEDYPELEGLWEEVA